jgi:hypothetical protein
MSLMARACPVSSTPKEKEVQLVHQAEVINVLHNLAQRL